MTLEEKLSKHQFASETDAPYEVFRVGKALNIDQNVRALALHDQHANVKNVLIEDFLEQNIQDILKGELKIVNAFRVGSVSITYLIVGEDRAGNHVLIRVNAVET